MNSELPDGWETRSLAATAAVCTSGYWGEDQAAPDFLPARVIRNGDVGEGRIKELLPTRFFTTKQIERARVFPGDAILVSSGNVGRIARVGARDATPITVASNFVRLVRAGPSATGDFLGHLLASSLVQHQLANHIAGSAIKNLHGSAYEEVMLPLPPLAEQRKIAAILTVVDETIEKTDAVIAQLEVVKKAMLEELLTRGIPGRHSRFKQTEIGEVPQEWAVEPLEAVTERITYGFTNPMPTTSEGPWLITAANVRDGFVDWATARHTDRDAFRIELTDKSRPAVRDILVTKDGTLGRVALVDREDVCVNQSVACLRADGTRVLPEFLAWALRAPEMQARILGDAGGSTIKHIYISKLAKTNVVLPPIAEQGELLSVFAAHQARERSESSCLVALLAAKASLSDGLLGGVVRVSGPQ